jgi:hypothetical protein
MEWIDGLRTAADLEQQGEIETEREGQPFAEGNMESSSPTSLYIFLFDLSAIIVYINGLGNAKLLE